MRNSSLAVPPYNQYGRREPLFHGRRAQLNDPIRGAKGSARKGEPPANEPGVRRDPFWDNRALPGLSPGDFSSPYLVYKRLTGMGSASDQFLTQEQNAGLGLA
jgi:hypothetical protein